MSITSAEDTADDDDTSVHVADNETATLMLDGMMMAEFDDNLFTAQMVEDNWEEILLEKAAGEIEPEEIEDESDEEDDLGYIMQAWF